MRSSKITVCITSFNQEQYIKQSIESVLNQTFLPYELIIIDDNSVDDTVAIIKEYSLKYAWIRTIFNNVNLGITKTRNIALREALGDYITFLDGDDYFLPKKLEDELSLLGTGNYDFAYSNFNIVTNDGVVVQSWMDFQKSALNENIFVKTFSLDFPNKVTFRSELVNLEKWREIGLFDENLEIWEDFDMRIRLSKNLSGVYNPRITHVYRRHTTGLSSTKIALCPFSLRYILRKNAILLVDVKKRDKRKIHKSLNSIISNCYIFLASKLLSEKKLSYKVILPAAKYALLSQKFKVSLKPIFHLTRLLVSNLIIALSLKFQPILSKKTE